MNPQSIPAIFIGIQQGYGVFADIPLFNLTVAIPGHPIGSTVSDRTLRAAGFSDEVIEAAKEAVLS